MGEGNTNGWFSNVLLGGITWVTMILGAVSVAESLSSGLGFKLPEGNGLIITISIVSFFISVGIFFMVSIYKRKRKQVLFVKDYITFKKKNEIVIPDL